MEWINEMFTTMEKERAAESVEKEQKNARKIAQEKRPAKQAHGAPDVWNTLVSSIEEDVKAFNSHEKRAAQTKVSMHHSQSQCEVYLSGMHSKRLVLTLDDNDLRVSVHPDFPAQQVAIRIEPDLDGQHAFWVLGEPGKEGVKLPVQDLSYLLKPILCSAAIDREL